MRPLRLSVQTYRESADGVNRQGVGLIVAHLCGILRWICGMVGWMKLWEEREEVSE
jgi:hypothetical protein